MSDTTKKQSFLHGAAWLALAVAVVKVNVHRICEKTVLTDVSDNCIQKQLFFYSGLIQYKWRILK